MTGAMYAAIAGLKAHMNKLSVIGNNVANVNTTAFKAQRTVFRDSLYSMYSSGSSGSTTAGGTNPSQVGYGSSLASIDINMASGTYSPGYSLDCMISGDGFFLVGAKDVNIDPTNPESLKSLTLTRVGDFTFDANGYLTDGRGNVVYGFLNTGNDIEGNPQVCDQLVPIRLPQVQTAYYQRADDGTSEEIEADEYNTIMTEGTDAEKASVYTEQAIRWPSAGDDGSAALTDYVLGEDETGSLAVAQMESVSIDAKTGAISGICKDTGDSIIIGYLSIGNVTNPNGLTAEGDSYYRADASAGDMQVSLLGGVAQELGISYVNGSLYAGALEEAIENGTLAEEYEDAPQSQKMTIGSAGDTKLMTGGLEGSNVDLATEISEMITTQRGYQANTRIITVTDSMLEELVNMKR